MHFLWGNVFSFCASKRPGVNLGGVPPPWHFLNLFPDPQGQGSFRPVFVVRFGIVFISPLYLCIIIQIQLAARKSQIFFEYYIYRKGFTNFGLRRYTGSVILLSACASSRKAGVRSAIWTRVDALSTAEAGSVRTKNVHPQRAKLPEPA